MNILDLLKGKKKTPLDQIVPRQFISPLPMPIKKAATPIPGQPKFPNTTLSAAKPVENTKQITKQRVFDNREAVKQFIKAPFSPPEYVGPVSKAPAKVAVQEVKAAEGLGMGSPLGQLLLGKEETAFQRQQALYTKAINAAQAKGKKLSLASPAKEIDKYLTPSEQLQMKGVQATIIGSMDISGGLKKLPKNLSKLPAVASRAKNLFGESKLVQMTDNLDDMAGKVKQGAKSVFEKERGFITSAKEVVPEATKIAGQYIPRSTDDLAMKARNLIIDNPDEAERIALTGTDEIAVATASELIKKYGDDARKATGPAQQALFDKAAEIANSMAPKLTELGRSIQAASILGRLTPEGQLRFAAKEIDRYNAAQATKLIPGKPLPPLSGEEAGEILTRMKAINEMEDGIDKSIEFNKLKEDMAARIPTDLWKKITTVWKAGLLTGIKTSGLNIMANWSHTGSEVIKDAPAIIVDKVASLFTGKRTKASGLQAWPKGVKEGFQKGKQFFKTGYDERNTLDKLDYKKVNFGKGKVAKAFQIYTDTVFRVLGTSDQPFYYGALSRSLMDQATAQGINKGLKGKALKEFAEDLVQNPTEEMIRYATADAATAVFQNETYLGKAAKHLQDIPVVGQIVVPFAKTPSAVAMQIIKYSPVGVIAEISQQIAKGKFDQRVFSEAMGRSITGTAALYLGYQAAKSGIVALDRPTTEREQKLWELEGKKPNSIKIGNKWRSVTTMGPIGNLILIGGHFQKQFKESGSPTEAMSKALFGTMKSFGEQTFLTGLTSANNALTNPERYAYNYLGQMASSIVPTIVSDTARAIDPKERRTNTILDRVTARVPGARQTLEPSVDVLGRERESIGNPLEIMLDPTRPSPADNTPTVKELRRLTDAGFEVSPTLLGDKQGYEILTPEENTALWNKAGDIINSKLTALFTHPKYQKLDDDQKAELVEDYIEKAKVVSRAAMAVRLTDGLKGEELKTKLGELKADGLLTRDVFAKYKEIR